MDAGHLSKYQGPSMLVFIFSALIPIRMATISKTPGTTASDDLEERIPWFTAGGNADPPATLESSRETPQKANSESPMSLSCI